MINVRFAVSKDIGDIVEFQLRMAQETENIALNPDTVLKGVAAVFENSSLGKYFVSEYDGEVVASMMLTPEWSDWRNSTFLWIQSVYVMPDFRKTGIFRKMYEFVKVMVENSPEYAGLRLYVEVNNKKAQEVYNRLGMTGEHYRMFEWEK
jgi:ribosomal protein S18 acetylase RimI-like enzyme